MLPCFFFSASKMVENGDRIMMKELDKSLSGKSGEREVKLCKNQELLPPS
jgi:hypothetical protein